MLDVTERQQAAQEIAQRNRELQALLNVSQRLSCQSELKERLQAIIDTVVETIAAADAASLWLYDDKCEQLVVHVWSGYEEETIANLSAPTTEALARLVSEARQPRLVTGRRKSRSWAQFSLEDNEENGKRFVLGVPILLEGCLLGAIFADSFCPEHAFDQHHLRLLQSMAGEVAIAVKNAQLLEATQRHRQELQQLSGQLLAAREAEARRISRELHDVMGQALTAISINLAEVRRALPPELLTGVQERLQESETLTAQTLNEVRELSLELRPSMLDELGLLPTLRWYLHRSGQRLGIQVSLEVEGISRRMTPEVETILYRVVQEGLTNVARHAQATAVCVRITYDAQQLEMAIEDDGVGFDTVQLAATVDGTHMGLLGMRERVALMGGMVRVDSAPGQGTRRLIHLPSTCREAPVMAEQKTGDHL